MTMIGVKQQRRMTQLWGCSFSYKVDDLFSRRFQYTVHMLKLPN